MVRLGNIPGSSNGRTSVFGTENWGSTPYPGTSKIKAPLVSVLILGVCGGIASKLLCSRRESKPGAMCEFDPELVEGERRAQ